ncbi:MAG: thioredoxin domain-containing protein [Oscillospiraceae bacterium]|nr:thioredoxin domain-containing protein [Oscillospiraceae bacterium]
MTQNRKPNRLTKEKSPYLLQHAYNPVNWYPWGEEAFEKAKKEDKPIFLSVGYSTCHWCHVMERESFEDEEVASLLNQSFVAIKVDREERPDIDAVYMKVCQAMTGSGGWPTTLFLSPDQTPFFAGTYFPKHTRYQFIGLIELLQTVAQKWKTDRELLLEAGQKTVQLLQEEQNTVPAQPSEQLFQRAYAMFSRSFDPRWGGFGGAPKFPAPQNLMFLLRYGVYLQEPNAISMVEKTLEQMYRGGLFDHIGGGFSRYSTDEKWLVPHFEKMLYDNALLTLTYLEAFQVTGRALYASVAKRTLAYIQKEMTHPAGGFYSAQDADSEGVEGKYYVFTSAEIRTLLGEKEGEAFCHHFGLTEWGNFEGKNIPNLLKQEERNPQDESVRALTNTVYEYRGSRMKLHTDDKILTSWNALMTAAFSKAYQVFQEPCYLSASVSAMEFIKRNLTDRTDGLRVRWRDGEASGAGYLDDYAFFIYSCLSLYESTLETSYLETAARFGKRMLDDFWDKQNGGFYLSAKSSEPLIARPKEIYDGAMPSGNSMAGYVLAKLFQLTGEPVWREASERQTAFLTAHLDPYPISSGFALVAAMADFYPPEEITCIPRTKEDAEAFRQTLGGCFLPNLAAAIKWPGQLSPAPFAKDLTALGEKTTYYFCENHVCHAPVTDLEEFRRQLSQAQFVHRPAYPL